MNDLLLCMLTYSCCFHSSFANDIEYMTGSRPHIFWLVCWKYISPTALIVVFIASVVKNAQTSATYSAFVGCVQVSRRRLID